MTLWQALLETLIMAGLMIFVPVAAWIICGPAIDAIPNAVSWILDQFQKEDDER